MSWHKQTLGLCPIFQELSAENIRQLDIRCRWRRYDAGKRIRDVEAWGPDLCFVVNGEIRVSVRHSNGKSIIIRDLYRGSFAGGITVPSTQVSGKPMLLAVTNSVVAKMPWQTFQKTALREPGLLQNFLAAVRADNASIVERLIEISFLRVRERICAELIRLSVGSNISGETAIISPPPAQADIAARVSTHREAVSRAINELERDGLLERRRSALVIKDLPRLRELIGNSR